MFVGLVLAAAAAFAPPADAKALREQIIAADDILFERSFNQCDMAALEGILMPDAEMIHDQAGVNHGREAFMAPVRENICNGGPQKPIRKRVEPSIEIYPLYQDGRLYGALEQGQHEFYLREQGKPLVLTNRARFIILWTLTSEGWKLKSTVSWSHLNPNENGPLDADVLVAGFDRNDEVDYMLAAHRVEAQNVAIIRDGALVEDRANGRAAEGRRAAVDTIYNVASLAKPVSAVLALRLADAKLIDLDAPLAADFVDPDIAASPYAGRVTPRMVLSHTSGLPNWRNLDEGAKAGKLRFVTEPGSTYSYSGEGFEWLRKAIERKTGRSWEDLAREFVFQPAGMGSSSYLYPKDQVGRLASRYDASGKRVDATPQTQANAAANFMTTSGDYARFVAFVMAGAGLSPKLAKDMLSEQVRISDHKSFGLGWQLITHLSDGGFAIQHSGADAGVRSLALAWPERREAIVILSNSDNAIPTWGLIIGEAFGARGEETVALNR
jgi:CubicO group peptidase (beta-lactamase class C family)